MKINDIIKKKRITLGMTQEQVADYLGVSTPAVNKWEKGGCYRGRASGYHNRHPSDKEGAQCNHL